MYKTHCVMHIMHCVIYKTHCVMKFFLSILCFSVEVLSSL